VIFVAIPSGDRWFISASAVERKGIAPVRRGPVPPQPLYRPDECRPKYGERLDRLAVRSVTVLQSPR